MLQTGVVGRALPRARLVEHAGERFDLAPEVHLGAVRIVFQRLQPGRVGRRLHFRAVVVRLERPEDVLGVVDEVEDERRVLAGRGAVEPRERLHRLHPVEPLVDVHRAQQRLVEAGLVLVGDQQHLVVGRVEARRQRRLADGTAGRGVRVHARLGVFDAGVGVAHRAAERDQGPDVRVAALGQIALERELVADRVQPRGGDDHRLRPAVEPVLHATAEVLDDHLRLLLQIVRVQAHELRQRPRRLLPGQVRIVRRVLEEPVVGSVRVV